MRTSTLVARGLLCALATSPALAAAQDLLIRNATVHTVTERGTLERVARGQLGWRVPLGGGADALAFAPGARAGKADSVDCTGCIAAAAIADHPLPGVPPSLRPVPD